MQWGRLMNSPWRTLIVIGVALLLSSSLRGLLTFGLQRWWGRGPAVIQWRGRVFTFPWDAGSVPNPPVPNPPVPNPPVPNPFIEAWVARLLMPLQLAILLGAGLLIVNVIAPNGADGADGAIVWPSLLALAVIAAALAPGNLISEGIGYARIRLFTYYHVGDWVTLADNQTGRVTAIHLMATALRTATGDWVWIGNSQILRRPIIQHDSLHWAAGSDQETAWLPRSRQGVLPRLSKRSLLGATSTHGLVRKRGA